MKTWTNQLALAITLVIATNTADAQEAIDTPAQTRIVGGINVDIRTAPATVALISNDLLAQTGSYFQAQFCGGTVISARWVVTAAHCISQNGQLIPTHEISVLMGTTDLEAPVNQPIGITRVIAHPDYNDSDTRNDIALLQLEYDALVEPASINTVPIAFNDEALITGWGALNEGSEFQSQFFTSVLQAAVVNMVPGDQCGTMFPVYSGQVDSRNLCAGTRDGGVDSCQGDSGGPLYRFDPALTTNVLTGVVSWGFGCANAQAPGVYTRVAAFSDWLRSTTGSALEGPDSPPTGKPVPANDSATGPVVSESSGTEETTNLLVAGSSGFMMLLLMLTLAIWRQALLHRQPLPTDSKHGLHNNNTPA